MTLTTLMFLIFATSFSMPLVSQPISLGLTLLSLTLLISLIIFFCSSGWFSFILFLIYIGGLLVMFAYITALMPNLIFKKAFTMKFFTASTLFWLIIFSATSFIGIMSEEQTAMKFSWPPMLNHLGISLYSPFNFITTVSLALILFFVLICVVKICYFSNAPLRPYKN
uniref:NADH-ubiquinone oxidoreductase chain 6 n=1 Tax=Nuttallochiton mirandus TaxID=256062 RepID=A0A6H1PGR2_NULMI|nr:NADH dehydrogenase subunit 6 [Nuttallochiton mirandus]